MEINNKLTEKLIEEFVDDLFNKKSSRDIVAYTGIQGGIDYLRIIGGLHNLTRDEIENSELMLILKKIKEEGGYACIKIK